MSRAYDEIYLDDAMNNLGDMFDYAVNDCGFDPEEFFDCFVASKVAEAFEKGNPKYVTGLSGPELASEIIYRTSGLRPDTRLQKTPIKVRNIGRGGYLRIISGLPRAVFLICKKTALP